MTQLLKQMLGCGAHVRIIDFRTCDVRAEVCAEQSLEVCVRCRCVWAIFEVRFAIALFYLFAATFNLFLHLHTLHTYFRSS